MAPLLSFLQHRRPTVTLCGRAFQMSDDSFSCEGDQKPRLSDPDYSESSDGVSETDYSEGSDDFGMGKKPSVSGHSGLPERRPTPYR